MKRNPFKLIILLLAVILGLTACTGQAGGSATPQRAPEFKLQSTDGGVVSLSELRGQIVFLNFWTTT